MAESNNLSFFYQLITDKSLQASDLNGPTSVQESKVKDSDEIFEMHCETCNRDRKYVTASAFCTSCVAYLCTTCLHYHGKFLPNHRYLDKDNIPQDVCTEKCKFHVNELIKFYCVTCDKFACEICKTKEHNVHCILKYLPEFVNDVENSAEFKEVITASAEINKILTDSNRKINGNQEQMSNISKEVKGVIKSKKEDMFSRFDQEAVEIERKIESVMKSDKQRLHIVTEKFTPIKSEIDKLSTNVKQLSKYPKSRKYKLFIEVKQIGHGLKQMEGSVKDLSKDVCSCKDSLKTELRMHANDLIQRVKELRTEAKELEFKTAGKRMNEERKLAFAMEDINASDWSDTSDCFIVNCCLLSDQYLIACDRNNRSIKLVDRKRHEVIYFRRVKTFPDAATKISDTLIAMAQPFDKDEHISIIQFLTVTSAKELEFHKPYILTEMRCMDIIYVPDGRLIISMSENHKGKIQILDMNGKVLSCIDANENGGEMFKCPFYMTLSSEREILFVSDWYKDCIIEIDLVNKSKRVLDHRFWHPEGITIDNEGYIYVCESGTKRICVFHPDESGSQVLLEKESHQWEPSSICYSRTDRKLYIGQDGLNYINVYRITDR